MINIILEAATSSDKYFTALSQFGYKKYDDVNKLILLEYIEEIIIGPFSEFITNEDYNCIVNVLYSLYSSSCLISYPFYIQNLPVFNNPFSDGMATLATRLSLDSVIRLNQENILRSES